jgi:tetratricopeptide (TPR) repeat protein
MSKPLSPLVILPVALVCGLGGGMIGARLSVPEHAPATEVQASAPSPELPRIAELEARVQSLSQALEAGLSAGPTRVEAGDDQIERAVARWMEQNGLRGAAVAPIASPVAGVSPEKRLADALAALENPELSDAERQKIWAELAKAGLVDQLLAQFEERAKLAPNDPDAQVELGSAYLQRLFQATPGPEQGLWAGKADKAFDAALALDSNHWEARFSKAVSLSFWPPIFGKQKEAVSHFETLLSQQSQSSAKDPRFAQTHLLLGNLYQQSGNAAKASETWAAGLALYPDNASLKEKVGQ